MSGPPGLSVEEALSRQKFANATSVIADRPVEGSENPLRKKYFGELKSIDGLLAPMTYFDWISISKSVHDGESIEFDSSRHFFLKVNVSKTGSKSPLTPAVMLYSSVI